MREQFEQLQKLIEIYPFDYSHTYKSTNRDYLTCMAKSKIDEETTIYLSYYPEDKFRPYELLSRRPDGDTCDRYKKIEDIKIAVEKYFVNNQ